MFGRLLVYLGQLWQSLKPDPEPGSRYNVAAAVLNLTGTGSASRDMRWPGAGLATQLVVLERNLARENADDLLAGIEGTRWSRGVLPWLPLMTIRVSSRGGRNSPRANRTSAAVRTTPV